MCLFVPGAGERRVNAGDRPGKGPRYNAKGVFITQNIIELHLCNKTTSKETALTKKTKLLNGRSDIPNQHDILTDSMGDGTAYFPDKDDHTFYNWTSSDTGSA